MSYNKPQGVTKPRINNSRSSDRRLAAGRAPASYLHAAVQSSLATSTHSLQDGLKRPEKINDSKNFHYVTPATSRNTAGTAYQTKTVQRKVGNQKWSDPTLLEWDPSHFRLFVGNLGTDANDELLYQAFAKYPSLTKVKVPVDNKSKVNRGYGFVAFSDSEDYFKAFKEMNGKYIGQHPVQLKRAQTEIKPTVLKQRKGKGKGGRHIN